MAHASAKTCPFARHVVPSGSAAAQVPAASFLIAASMAAAMASSKPLPRYAASRYPPLAYQVIFWVWAGSASA